MSAASMMPSNSTRVSSRTSGNVVLLAVRTFARRMIFLMLRTPLVMRSCSQRMLSFVRLLRGGCAVEMDLLGDREEEEEEEDEEEEATTSSSAPSLAGDACFFDNFEEGEEAGCLGRAMSNTGETIYAGTKKECERERVRSRRRVDTRQDRARVIYYPSNV